MYMYMYIYRSMYICYIYVYMYICIHPDPQSKHIWRRPRTCTSLTDTWTSLLVNLFFVTLQPRVEWYTNLWALNTSPPQIRALLGTAWHFCEVVVLAYPHSSCIESRIFSIQVQIMYMYGTHPARAPLWRVHGRPRWSSLPLKAPLK